MSSVTSPSEVTKSVPRLAVTFDTNVYRGLGTTSFAALRDREANHNVIGFACYPVVSELLSHLGTPGDPEAKAAKAAIERLASHCTEYNGSQHIVRFLAGAIEQICFALFQVQPTDTEDDPLVYGRLIGEIITDPEAAARLAQPLATIAQGTEVARAKYVDQLWRSVVQTLVPGAKNWNEITRGNERKVRLLRAIDAGEDLALIGSALVTQAAGRIKRPLDEGEIPALVEKLILHYPVVVHYRSLITRRLIEYGPDMSKRQRANGVLDVHVCTATSPFAVIAGLPQILVTNDADIVEAGNRAGVRHRLLTLQEYEALLGNDPAGFQAALDSWPTRLDS